MEEKHYANSDMNIYVYSCHLLQRKNLVWNGVYNQERFPWGHNNKAGAFKMSKGEIREGGEGVEEKWSGQKAWDA